MESASPLERKAPQKQRHAARRVLARLIEEHGAQELSYPTVRDYVRVRRAQKDFGDVWVVLNGVKSVSLVAR